MRIGRYAGALAVISALAAGCGGGSSRHATATSPGAEIFSAPVRPPPRAAALPGSSHGPMVCTVYDSGFATQVIFTSRTFDVRAQCRAWTRNRGDEGYLWGYQPVRATIQPTESRQVCRVSDRAGIVAALVVEATGLRPVSRAQAAHASSACTSLLASGWVRLDRRRRASAHR